MASRKIQLRKRKNFTKIPNDIYEGSKRKIGATLTRSGEINTGITLKEQKEWLPDLVGISADSNTFFTEVKKFYANLTIEVPAELEIGKDEDGEFINKLDYLKYRFAVVNPSVAEDRAGADASARNNVLYYLHDTVKEKEERFSIMQLEKQAYKEFIKVSDNVATVSQILQVLGVDVRHLSKEDRELALEVAAKKDPVRFIEVVKDKNLETKAFVQDCLTAEVLRKVGNTILDGDFPLGTTMEEAVLYLKDKKHSDLFATLKARLSEFNKG